MRRRDLEVLGVWEGECPLALSLRGRVSRPSFVAPALLLDLPGVRRALEVPGLEEKE